jgi:hypothetical protein
MGTRCSAVVRALTCALFFGWIRLASGRRAGRTAATSALSLRVPRDYVKAMLNHKGGDVTAIYAHWHMFEEKREAATAIEAAGLPLMSAPIALAA